MTIDEAERLKRGDVVIWNDPDDGICTKAITVSRVTVIGDTVCLVDRDSGDCIECFAGELEFDR